MSDLALKGLGPSPAVPGMQRLMAILLPAPVDLMPGVLAAAGTYHDRTCGADGCRVVMRGVGHRGRVAVIEHGIPEGEADG